MPNVLHLRFQILKAMSIKMTAFWDVVSYSLVAVDKTFHRPDDGRSTHLWNVGLLQRDYMELHPTNVIFNLLHVGEI
jgi:hypothetical protein